MSDLIKRYSSRTHHLDETLLLEHLTDARRYHRIAGYFTSSLFEVVDEALEAIDEVRIVCNSDVQFEDLKVARLRETELLGRLNDRSVEADTLLNRPRYQRLYDFLSRHPDAIRVAPEEHCGFLHGKAGVIEKLDGQRIGFIGSLNETRSGWQRHYEIVWSDESDAGVEWIEAEFEWLWEKAYCLPRAVVQEVYRRAHRVEIELDETESEDELAPAALVEAPMYREGLSLKPWQRAFVTECLKHRRLHGCVRLLLADEVGLGKTLSLATAALVLTLLSEQEENARRHRVAIFVPAALAEQWQTELVDKLGLPSGRWDSHRKTWLDPENRAISPRGAEYVTSCPMRIGIISTGIITQPTEERAYLKSLTFETIVLDESHKARTRQGYGSDSEDPNRLLEFMQTAAAQSHHVLLGTATPIQTDPKDLWDQLSILHRSNGHFVLGNEFSPWHDPDQALPVLTGNERLEDPEQAWKFLRSPFPFVDSSSEDHFRRVMHEIRSELGLAEDEVDANAPVVDLPVEVREDLQDLLETEVNGATFFQRHNPAVRHVVLRRRSELEEANLLVKVGVDLHPDRERVSEPNTWAAIFTGNAVQTTDTFDRAYQAAEEFGKHYSKRVSAPGFMKNLMRQRICSSCHAAQQTAQRLLEGQTIEVDDESMDEEGMSDEERRALERLTETLVQMNREDPKLQAVRHYLFTEGWIDYGCIIFSQYFDTAQWIADHLAKDLPNDLIGLYAGAGKSALYRGPDDQTVADRVDLKRLVEERHIRVMVATDAACEGLNLQRLGTLINVDLPWNPTRLEQRVGRIKRFGQSRDTVDMLNLVYQDTVDETIYERLSQRMYDRYNLFGSLPDTIDDDWIDDVEKLEEELDRYIEAQKRATGFDIRYNDSLDAEEDEWRNCVNVLSRRAIEDIVRRGW